MKGLLVSVSKETLQSAKSCTVEAVARVNGSYRFAALADFQYVADESLKAQGPQVLVKLLP